MEKIKGKTIKGRGLGKELGFPTLNLEYAGVDFGVFAGYAFLDGEQYLAAINLGPAPTVGRDKALCEAFLLDFAGEILEGSLVEVEVCERIRDVQKFESLEDLKEQISRDVESVKNWYNARI